MDKYAIHFHGGTTALASITDEDIELENERLKEVYSEKPHEKVESAEELIESALRVPPRPRWTWIGDAFVFTQAVCGVAPWDGH